MKKLRFLGIMVGVMVLCINFSVSGVDAAKCQITEYFIDKPPKGMSGGQNLIPGETSGVNPGDSRCNYKYTYGTSDSTWSKFYLAVVRTCNTDGIYDDIECAEDQVCAKIKEGDGYIRKCVKKGSCPYNGGWKYYQGGNLNSVDFSFDKDGDMACFNDGGVIKAKVCNLYTGEWDDTGESKDICTSGQTCVMSKTGSDPMDAYCESECKNPNGLAEDVYCNESENKLYKCYSSTWNEKTFSEIFPGENCEKCIQDVNNGAMCVKKNSSDLVCSKIEGQTESPGEGISVTDGAFTRHTQHTYVCNSDRTKLYVCGGITEEAQNAAADGYYTLSQDCSKNDNTDGKGKVRCGVVGSSTVPSCITEDEYKNNDQGALTRSIEASMSTNNDFLCTTNKGESGINTALGCIPITISGLAEKVLPLLFGIAGGISFLLMVYGFIMVATSSGDEKKLVEARSRITSAITGLLVSIFAIFLFRLIFSNILKIPGL